MELCICYGPLSHEGETVILSIFSTTTKTNRPLVWCLCGRIGDLWKLAKLCIWPWEMRSKTPFAALGGHFLRPFVWQWYLGFLLSWTFANVHGLSVNFKTVTEILEKMWSALTEWNCSLVHLLRRKQAVDMGLSIFQENFLAQSFWNCCSFLQDKDRGILSDHQG